MKTIFSLALCILALTAWTNVRAQVMNEDSAYVSFIESSPDGQPNSIMGAPDGKYADILPGGANYLNCYFRRSTTASTYLPILKGSTIRIYGLKDVTVDSSAVSIYFAKQDASGALLYSSKEYFADKTGITTIIPDSTYTYITFTTTGAFTHVGSKSYLIDAVELIQDFHGLKVEPLLPSAHSMLVSNYPNPFITNGRTLIQVHLVRPAQAAVVVTDAIGRVVGRIELGHVNAGDYAPDFQAAIPGVYFARLLTDGVPTGAVLKMTSFH